MGLFDAVLGNSPSRDRQLGASDAFATIALLAVNADGYISEDELRALRGALWRLKLFRGYTERELEAAIGQVREQIRRDGAATMFRAAMAGLPQAWNETVFAIAVDLVLVDGEITQGEEELLQSLYRALNIPKSTALKIIDVMVIKNKV